MQRPFAALPVHDRLGSRIVKELGKYDDSKILKNKICKMKREEIFENWRKNWNLKKMQ